MRTSIKPFVSSPGRRALALCLGLASASGCIESASEVDLASDEQEITSEAKKFMLTNLAGGVIQMVGFKASGFVLDSVLGGVFGTSNERVVADLSEESFARIADIMEDTIDQALDEAALAESQRDASLALDASERSSRMYRRFVYSGTTLDTVLSDTGVAVDRTIALGQVGAQSFQMAAALSLASLREIAEVDQLKLEDAWLRLPGEVITADTVAGARETMRSEAARYLGHMSDLRSNLERDVNGLFGSVRVTVKTSCDRNQPKHTFSACFVKKNGSPFGPYPVCGAEIVKIETMTHSNTLNCLDISLGHSNSAAFNSELISRYPDTVGHLTHDAEVTREKMMRDERSRLRLGVLGEGYQPFTAALHTMACSDGPDRAYDLCRFQQWVAEGAQSGTKRTYTFNVPTAGRYEIFAKLHGAAAAMTLDGTLVQSLASNSRRRTYSATYSQPEFVWVGGSNYELSTGVHTVVVNTANTDIQGILVRFWIESAVASKPGFGSDDEMDVVVRQSAVGGELTGTMKIGSDQRYVWVRPGDSVATASANYTFSVPVSGWYRPWALTQAANGEQNSFSIAIMTLATAPPSDSPLATINLPFTAVPLPRSVWDVKQSASFVWDRMSRRSDTSTENKDISVFLTAGQHVLSVQGRESGTKLGEIYLTNLSNARP